jgi:hypothetical protein
MNKIFVAGPYNHPDEIIKSERLLNIKKYCVKVFNEGDAPISALLMGLSISDIGGLPTDTETWREFSKKMVKGCDEMHVLSGWEESGGVKAEIEEALRIGIIVKYI